MNTLEKYRNQRPALYSRLPTIDVPIIEDGHRICAQDDCEQPDVVFQHPYIDNDDVYRSGGWVHVEGGAYDHPARPGAVCIYCGSSSDLVHTQEPWHDALSCSRCGGVNGWPVGD